MMAMLIVGLCLAVIVFWALFAAIVYVGAILQNTPGIVTVILAVAFLANSFIGFIFMNLIAGLI